MLLIYVHKTGQSDSSHKQKAKKKEEEEEEEAQFTVRQRYIVTGTKNIGLPFVRKLTPLPSSHTLIGAFLP